MSALLTAVNRAIEAVALPATSSLDEPVPRHVAVARKMVESEDRHAQLMGWQFNTLTDVTYLVDDTTGKVTAPATLLNFTPRGTDSRNVTTRDGFFYDLDDATDQFTKDLRGRALLQVIFADCPAYFREYVAARAARRLYTQLRGDPAGVRDVQGAELMARADALRQDALTARLNTIESQPVYQGYGTRLRRHR